MEEKKVLLSIKDLEVKFRVRGRILTAIRGISLDIYENESIAIVGESGSGKSVFTKTFAGMLDSNGFISNGSIVFNDEELAKTDVTLNAAARSAIANIHRSLNESAKLEAGAETYKKIVELKSERSQKTGLSDEEDERFNQEIKDLIFRKTEAFNRKQTLDPKKEKDQIKLITAEIERMEKAVKAKEQEKEALIRARKQSLEQDSEYNRSYQERLNELEARYREETAHPITKETEERNLMIAKEFYLCVGRYGFVKRNRAIRDLKKAAHDAMQLGVDLNDRDERARVFGDIALYTYLDSEEGDTLHGTCVNNLVKIKNPNDWTEIRGKRIATVFQDPMTSLNPILTIGNQITSIILKHQDCTEAEARARALEMMYRVGIPNPEKRFDDYPFQYSGGMRQRIVIAIALSCQPKILICDEPTTALDVTERSGLHDRVHHARPGRRRQHRRPRRRALRRRNGRAGRRRRGVLRSAPSLHLGPDVQPAAACAEEYQALLHHRYAAEPVQQDRRRSLRAAQSLLPEDRLARRTAHVQDHGHALRQDLAA